MTGLAANALPLLLLIAPPLLLIAGIALAARPAKERQAAAGEGHGHAGRATGGPLVGHGRGTVHEELGVSPTSGEVFRAMYRLYGRRHLR